LGAPLDQSQDRVVRVLGVLHLLAEGIDRCHGVEGCRGVSRCVEVCRGVGVQVGRVCVCRCFIIS
jgi:hypothetical protein